MANNSVFDSPWPELTPSTGVRVQALIPPEVVNQIKSVCPSHGLINHIIQSAFVKLYRDLQQLGYTTYSPDSHTAIVATLRNGPGPLTDLYPTPGDVSGPTAPTRSTSAGTANVSTDVPKSDDTRRRERRARIVKAKERLEKGKAGKEESGE